MKTKTINQLLLLLLILLAVVTYVSGAGTDGTTTTVAEGGGSVDTSGFYGDTDPLLTDTGTTTGSSATTESMTTVDTLSTSESTLTAPETQTVQSGQGAGYQMAHYTYDEFDRLKQTSYEDGTAIGFNYDKVGNRTAKTVGSAGSQIHTISINSTGPGEAVPYGMLAVMAGSSQTILLEPEPGAAVTALSVDGIRTLPASSVAFNNINASHTVSVTFGGSQSCSGYPAQLAGATPISHLTLQSAYDAAQAGDTIKGNLDEHPESLRFDRNVSVSIAGGYSCDFGALSGVLTVKGSMLLVSGGITIASGTVVLASP